MEELAPQITSARCFKRRALLTSAKMEPKGDLHLRAHSGNAQSGDLRVTTRSSCAFPGGRDRITADPPVRQLGANVGIRIPTVNIARDMPRLHRVYYRRMRDSSSRVRLRDKRNGGSQQLVRHSAGQLDVLFGEDATSLSATTVGDVTSRTPIARRPRMIGAPRPPRPA